MSRGCQAAPRSRLFPPPASVSRPPAPRLTDRPPRLTPPILRVFASSSRPGGGAGWDRGTVICPCQAEAVVARRSASPPASVRVRFRFASADRLTAIGPAPRPGRLRFRATAPLQLIRSVWEGVGPSAFTTSAVARRLTWAVQSRTEPLRPLRTSQRRVSVERTVRPSASRAVDRLEVWLAEAFRLAAQSPRLRLKAALAERNRLSGVRLTPALSG